MVAFGGPFPTVNDARLLDLLSSFLPAVALTPPVLMSLAALHSRLRPGRNEEAWRVFAGVSWLALAFAAGGSLLGGLGLRPDLESGWRVGPGLATNTPGLWLAVLVQFFGTVIGAFSARYLQGEPRQSRYVAALAAVLAGVQLLLLSDHWIPLIAAWAAVGAAMQRLLCFYPERPFALLAAHKKRLADRLADGLLVVSAALAWRETGSGSLADLWAHVEQIGMSTGLQWSAIALVLAVALRTALLPAHGWLIQVMEAPTPVSALLHAGVVNLGGFILIRFSPLLEAAPAARALLVAGGLATSALAALVMLTRVSIKVRLAWSTVAQMGFMVLECGLGLYTMAMLHLIGHSLYKAHAFLTSSSVVRESRLRAMRHAAPASTASLVLAPVLSLSIVLAADRILNAGAFPLWWSGILALAWAPLLWLPSEGTLRNLARGLFSGAAMATGLSLLAGLWHRLPFGLTDHPDHRAGLIAFLGLGLLYVCFAVIEGHSRGLSTWRRWSYAGFYVDEFYTRLALQLWPTRWTPPTLERQNLTPAIAAVVAR